MFEDWWLHVVHRFSVRLLHDANFRSNPQIGTIRASVGSVPERGGSRSSDSRNGFSAKALALPPACCGSHLTAVDSISPSFATSSESFAV